MSVCCNFTSSVLLPPPHNTATVSWLSRITANGGAAPAAATVTAINDLYNAIDAAGITSKILQMAMFVPDSLIAARTPLFKVIGNDPWGTTFTNGDLGANGITGNSHYLDPGCVPAFMSAQWSALSACIFFYSYATNTTPTGTDVGCTDGSNDSFFIAEYGGGGGLHCVSDLQGAAPRLNVANPGNGFLMASRIAANNNQIYFANSSTPWASIANNAVGSIGFSTAGFLIFAFNNNGSIIQYSNGTLSCAGFAAGLTSGEGQALYNAIQACRVALGGGFR